MKIVNFIKALQSENSLVVAQQGVLKSGFETGYCHTTQYRVSSSHNNNFPTKISKIFKNFVQAPWSDHDRANHATKGSNSIIWGKCCEVSHMGFEWGERPKFRMVNFHGHDHDFLRKMLPGDVWLSIHFLSVAQQFGLRSPVPRQKKQKFRPRFSSLVTCGIKTISQQSWAIIMSFVLQYKYFLVLGNVSSQSLEWPRCCMQIPCFDV